MVLQGFTTDGRYIVRGHFMIQQPKLPQSAEDKTVKGKVIFDFDEESGKAAKWLEKQPDDSFEPTFAQYRIFLQALRIEPPQK